MNKLIIVHNLEELLNQVRINKLTIAVLNGSCEFCEIGDDLFKEIAENFLDVAFIKVDISENNQGSAEIMDHFREIDPRFSYNDVIAYFGGGIVLGPERWPGTMDLIEMVEKAISMVQNRGCRTCKDGFVNKCPGYAHCPYKDYTENEGD